MRSGRQLIQCSGGHFRTAAPGAEKIPAERHQPFANGGQTKLDCMSIGDVPAPGEHTRP